MKYKFHAVVVIYNTEITQSVTCNNLLEIKNHNINVIIADNSTINNNNSKQSRENNWKYISMGGNVGLSKAYNRALDELVGEDGLIIWFDDDTNITQKYFDELDSELRMNPDIDILCPIIYGQDNKIYSPNEARFFKNKQLKNANDHINIKKFNAINSCTCVKLSVYDEYRYDERIFLDQVDHKFFEDQRAIGRKFYKMDTIINHNFSLKSKMKGPKECWKRYELMIPDFFVFCSSSKAKLVLGSIKVLGWGVRESINYRNPIFLVWCLKLGSKCLYGLLKENNK